MYDSFGLADYPGGGLYDLNHDGHLDPGEVLLYEEDVFWEEETEEEWNSVGNFNHSVSYMNKPDVLNNNGMPQNISSEKANTYHWFLDPIVLLFAILYSLIVFLTWAAGDLEEDASFLKLLGIVIVVLCAIVCCINAKATKTGTGAYYTIRGFNRTQI